MYSNSQDLEFTVVLHKSHPLLWVKLGDANNLLIPMVASGLWQISMSYNVSRNTYKPTYKPNPKPSYNQLYLDITSYNWS